MYNCLHRNQYGGGITRNPCRLGHYRPVSYHPDRPRGWRHRSQFHLYNPCHGKLQCFRENSNGFAL